MKIHSSFTHTASSQLVLVASAANELAAQHSHSWLVLAVAVTVLFRNPPPSPAPPVYHLRDDCHALYGSYFIYSMLYVQQQYVCGCVGSSKSLYCSATAAAV